MRRAGDRGDGAALVSLTVGDEPSSWAAAGFDVTEQGVDLGGPRIHLARAGEIGHGISTWTVAGLDAPEGEGDLDGLPTRFIAVVPDGLSPLPAPARDRPGPLHPNGVVGLDHLVVLTPDLERTTQALGDVGLACRRVRETTANGGPMRQAFFRLGTTIVEVVSGDVGSGLTASDAPSTWWGLAFDVADLDSTSAHLGPEGVGPVKPAVQAGRRIATLRHKNFGITVPIALMDDRADHTAPGATQATTPDPGRGGPQIDG